MFQRIKQTLVYKKDKKNSKDSVIKNRKDKIFIFVLVIAIGNLSWQLMSIIYTLFKGNSWKSPMIWAYLIADSLAIYGILWLINSYKRSLRGNAGSNNKTDEHQEE